MATIDLIVLGILKRESLSAYDIQKLVEYRNISKVGITGIFLQRRNPGFDCLGKNKLLLQNCHSFLR